MSQPSAESFDDKILESRESAHAVYRVRSGNEQYAIKEYKIKGAHDLWTCLKEAAIVHRLRHPAIVEIRALFQADSNMYMQMAWYDNGSLDKWVAGELRPEWHQVRQVLLDALLGLAHLHDNAVIHSDVKPSNVLVDGRERGRLADFEISIDTATRTSARAIRTPRSRPRRWGGPRTMQRRSWSSASRQRQRRTCSRSGRRCSGRKGRVFVIRHATRQIPIGRAGRRTRWWRPRLQRRRASGRLPMRQCVLPSSSY